MAGELRIRDARPDEAGLLTDLALRSKADWGYSAEFIDACRAELTVDAGSIVSPDCICRVAEYRSRVAGYHCVVEEPDNGFELDALFVEPDYIGQGIGRLLVDDAIRCVASLGGAILVIQGDPNAAGFYTAIGARPAGSRASASIPGRDLPLFELEIDR